MTETTDLLCPAFLVDQHSASKALQSENFHVAKDRKQNLSACFGKGA